MIKIKKYQIENYISDATQSALDLKADLVNGKVPASQLPSFVDDVIEVANYAALPIPGATGVIYITLDTNKVYRWTGSVYVEIASGSTNLSYTAGVSDGTVNSDTGTDATIPLADTTNAGLFSAEEKTKLSGIATGANVGVVPNAPITGATKTKITYDSKGLVTAGADATTADIADSINKRYVTDANLVVIGNTSGTNTGDQNLQQVLNQGSTANTGVILDISNTQGVLINLAEYSVGFTVSTVAGADLSYPLLFNNEYAIYFQVDNGGNLFSLGSLEAYSFVKSGGLSTEYLMADGSVTTGGGGNTDLGYTPSPTNGIVTSSTGTDATLPLADATNAGLITPAEKTKIANSVPYTGAISNVNLDTLIGYSNDIKESGVITIWPLSTSFGVVEIDSNNIVIGFKEKPRLDKWINIGYFILKKGILKNINQFAKFEDYLQFCGQHKLFKAYKHEGEHYTVNTIVELDIVEKNINKIIN
jgi:hypothetical protein